MSDLTGLGTQHVLQHLKQTPLRLDLQGRFEQAIYFPACPDLCFTDASRARKLGCYVSTPVCGLLVQNFLPCFRILWETYFRALTRGRYHGGQRRSSDNSFHSPTIVPPLAHDKPSIMKHYHHQWTTRWGLTACSPMMVTLHDTWFVECGWWNDGRTVKTVMAWGLSASMILATGVCQMVVTLVAGEWRWDWEEQRWYRTLWSQERSLIWAAHLFFFVFVALLVWLKYLLTFVDFTKKGFFFLCVCYFFVMRWIC